MRYCQLGTSNFGVLGRYRALATVDGLYRPLQGFDVMPRLGPQSP